MLFDAAIYAIAAVAVIAGFSAGLLRSLATILGYVAATAVAVGTAPALVLFLAERFPLQPAYDAAVLFGLVLILGMIFGALLKRVVNELVGREINVLDRCCGAVLGAARVGLLAVLLVLIFERIIPPGHEPPWLAESELKPYLSAAAQSGLRSLPPEVSDRIDRLKHARGI